MSGFREAFRPAVPWEPASAASDFICVRTLTGAGVVELYLFFIHIGSRRVIVSAPTANPDSAWVTQQARNASMQMQGG